MRLIKINYDKIIYNFVFIFACLLIISQIVLTVNNANTYVSTDDEVVFNVTLKLSGVKPSEKIAILCNGDPVAYFVNDTINLTVKNNSVIEIDGRKINKDFNVEITCDKHIDDIPQKINVTSNIAMVGRFIAR